MKPSFFTFAVLLAISQGARAQVPDPVIPAPPPLPPVDPALVPGSPSVEVETDVGQVPTPAATEAPKKRPAVRPTPATVVIKPANPFSGFRQIDIDHDGTVTLEELKKAFLRADLDSDGRLNIEEFQRNIVDQPLDAGGVPDPPQIVVVEEALPQDEENTDTRPSSPRANRRQPAPRNGDPASPSNGRRDRDDLDDDDVDIDGTTRDDAVPQPANPPDRRPSGTGDPNAVQPKPATPSDQPKRDPTGNGAGSTNAKKPATNASGGRTNQSGSKRNPSSGGAVNPGGPK